MKIALQKQQWTKSKPVSTLVPLSWFFKKTCNFTCFWDTIILCHSRAKNKGKIHLTTTVCLSHPLKWLKWCPCGAAISNNAYLGRRDWAAFQISLQWASTGKIPHFCYIRENTLSPERPEKVVNYPHCLFTLPQLAWAELRVLSDMDPVRPVQWK